MHVLVSCTNEEPISPEFQSQNDVEVISFNDDPTILQLSNLNDSLMSISSNVESRGKFWNIFKKVCKIAFADIKGAYNGYHTGGLMKESIDKWKARGLYIFYLPPYSPHLNIAETLWRILKTKWIKPCHYIDTDTLFNATNEILSGIGDRYRVNYSDVA